MKKSLFLITTLFLFSTLNGQKPQDFIISMTGDSIFGKIKFFPYKIIFKSKGIKASFYPETVQNFGIYKKELRGYVIFKPIRTYNKKKVFLKELSEGPLKLFKHSDAPRVTNINVRTSYYVGRTTESLQRLSIDYYKPVLGYFFKENATSTSQLSQANFFDIPELVRQFNETAPEFKWY